LDRRGILALLASGPCVAVAVGARSQGLGGTRRLGVLSLRGGFAKEDREVFDAVLRDAGWVEGRNLVLVIRDAEGKPDVLKQQAEELVGLGVDVIFARGAAAIIAARDATRRIPIVMVLSVDPVSAGFVASFARPEGNLTGYYSSPIELEGKRLDLVREVLPQVRRVAVLYDAPNMAWSMTRAQRDRIYQASGLEPVYIAVGVASEIVTAFDEAHRRGAQVLMIPRDQFWYENRDRAIAVALRLKLPIMAADDDVAAAGALLSLAPDEIEGYRTQASFVARILLGARPADLAVQQPTKFVLAVNLRTAATLGVNLPQSLLVRAEKVFR
jgi:putative ABC transport system substrate-binding protein